jgi:hypothetical protein
MSITPIVLPSPSPKPIATPVSPVTFIVSSLALPPLPIQATEVVVPSVSAPAPWSVDTVRIVPANGGKQRAPRSPDDDVAETSPDKVRRQQLEES